MVVGRLKGPVGELRERCNANLVTSLTYRPRGTPKSQPTLPPTTPRWRQAGQGREPRRPCGQPPAARAPPQGARRRQRRREDRAWHNLCSAARPHRRANHRAQLLHRVRGSLRHTLRIVDEQTPTHPPSRRIPGGRVRPTSISSNLEPHRQRAANRREHLRFVAVDTSALFLLSYNSANGGKTAYDTCFDIPGHLLLSLWLKSATHDQLDGRFLSGQVARAVAGNGVNDKQPPRVPFPDASLLAVLPRRLPRRR